MIARVRSLSLALLFATSALHASEARADDPPPSAPTADAPALEATAPSASAVSIPGAPARPANEAGPPPAPTVRRVDASEPRKITGMVLTGIGAFHGFAGTVVLATFGSMDGGFGFLLGLIIGGPFMGEGLILTSVGIPLWISGAKTVETVETGRRETRPSWAPSVEVGAGQATATWRF
ncbi:MAG: hypothetical protein JNK04_04720 [Myxococcales bacterium]|nr:hypothetical protein [Myxococcales bacterium]